MAFMANELFTSRLLSSSGVRRCRPPRLHDTHEFRMPDCRRFSAWALGETRSPSAATRCMAPFKSYWIPSICDMFRPRANHGFNTNGSHNCNPTTHHRFASSAGSNFRMSVLGLSTFHLPLLSSAQNPFKQKTEMSGNKIKNWTKHNKMIKGGKLNAQACTVSQTPTASLRRRNLVPRAISGPSAPFGREIRSRARCTAIPAVSPEKKSGRGCVGLRSQSQPPQQP